MRLVHDDRVFPVGQVAHLSGLSATKGNFCNVVMMIGTAVFSAVASWPAILVDLLDNALLVVELVDGVL